MSDKAIKTAKRIRKQHGGTIFAFPIELDNPHSKYNVVVYGGGKYFVYPETPGIEEAAAGVLTILEEFKKRGIAKSFDNDVRMIAIQRPVACRSVIHAKAGILN